MKLFSPALALAVGLIGCSERLERPTDKWARPFPSQGVPEGLQTLRAAECGLCHKEIYEEWSRSTHARAFVDAQFQFEWNKDQQIFLCRNCHAPLENQQPLIVDGLMGGNVRRPSTRPNPAFDAVLQDEAITCAACHVRDGAVLGPYGDQESAPHKVRRRAEGELAAALCTSCHQAEAHLDGTLVCKFATLVEWEASPYPSEGKDCISCHMPEIQRKNSATGAVRASNLHAWPGSGIPKLEEDRESVEKHFVSGLAVEMRTVSSTLTGVVEAEVVVENARAGHFLPTGDVERFITVRLEIIGPAGVLAAREERIGQVWQWSPEVKRLSDNRLKPRETRTYRLVSPVGAAKDTKMRVIVTNHRMTEQNAKQQKLLGRYPLRTEVLRKEAPLSPSGSDS